MYNRKISFNERFYLAADRILPPFCNQFFFEGKGKFDIDRWVTAIETASCANPGSRAVMRGFLWRSRWVDSGAAPRLRVVDGCGWSGMCDEGAPFLQTKLDPYRGPSCEVLLIQDDVLRVCFRTHHAVMDGRGTAFWAEEIFRVLRGEAPLGSNSTLTDFELAQTFQKERRFPPPHEFIAPTGRASGGERGVTWKRRRLQGKFRNFLPQVAVLVAAEARRRGPGKIRLAIPVDLRPRMEGLRSTGNLTNMIYIEIGVDATVQDVAADISKQIQDRYDGRIYHGEKIMNYVPVWMIAREVKKLTRKKHAAGLYHNSGIISNPGKLDLSKFSGGGFTAESWFGIPPCQEIIPFFIGLTGSGEMADLMVGMPRVLAGSGRLDEFMEAVIAGLKAE